MIRHRIIPGATLVIVGLLILADLAAHSGFFEENGRALYVELPNHDKTLVVGKTFHNERIVVDGKSFRDCKFSNVTLVYNGTGNFDFVGNSFLGVNLESDREAIEGAFLLTALIAKFAGADLYLGRRDH